MKLGSLIDFRLTEACYSRDHVIVSRDLMRGQHDSLSKICPAAPLQALHLHNLEGTYTPLSSPCSLSQRWLYEGKTRTRFGKDVLIEARDKLRCYCGGVNRMYHVDVVCN